MGDAEETRDDKGLEEEKRRREREIETELEEWADAGERREEEDPDETDGE